MGRTVGIQGGIIASMQRKPREGRYFSEFLIGKGQPILQLRLKSILVFQCDWAMHK